MTIVGAQTAILLVVLAGASSVAGAADPRVSGPAEITDGDTFSIGPVDIRLHGIDAPEAGQTCRTAAGKSWSCGSEASNRLAEMIEGKPVECTPLEQDAYAGLSRRAPPAAST